MKSGLKVGGKGSRIPDENLPPRLLSTPSPSRPRRRVPLEDHDPNSQDSGYAASDDSKSPAFRFAEPSGFAPRRLSSMESPRRNLMLSSFNSTDSHPASDTTDDNFLELFQAERMAVENEVPNELLGGLLSDPIVIRDRCTQHQLEAGAKRRGSVEARKAKRHKPLSETQPRGTTLFDYGFTKSSNLPPTPSQVQAAVERSMKEEVIGDFSLPFALPLMKGKHHDLKVISSDTLAKLLEGEFNDRIASFKIIDCRYPYEFDGGHIKGAVNLYTQEQIKRELVETRLSPPQLQVEKRNIIVFHCEFSQERGPWLSRYLREEDRRGNANHYPRLHYPELYLLHGGYHDFFQAHSSLCEPCSYKPMHDPAHSTEMKHFRAKSKTWSAAGTIKRNSIRSLSRLGF